MNNKINVEFFKLIKSKLAIILALILILIGIVSPVFPIISDKLFSNVGSKYVYTMFYFVPLENVNEKTTNFYNEIQRIEDDYSQFAIDSNLKMNEPWTQNAVFKLKVAAIKVAGINAINNGVLTSDIEQIIRNNDINVFLKNYSKMSNKEKDNALQSNKEKTDIYYNIVKNSDYREYNIQEIKGIELQNKDIEIRIKEMEPFANDEMLKVQLDLSKKELNNNNDAINLLNYRNNNNIDYSVDNWKNNAINELMNYITISQEALLSRENFIPGKFETYEEYKEDYDKRMKTAEEKSLIAKEALKNNNEDIIFTTNKSIQKNIINSMWIFSISFYIIILLVANSFGNEFSKGTIRMSLIRPISRTKFLLNKIVSPLVFVIVITIIAYLLNNIVFGLINGFDGINSITYLIENGVVTANNFFLLTLPKLLVSMLPLIFGATFAALLISIFKLPSIGIFLPLAICEITSLIGIFASTNKKAYEIFSYIPFGYNNINNLYAINNNIFSMNTATGVVTAEKGALLLIVSSIIFLILSILIFRKKDITN